MKEGKSRLEKLKEKWYDICSWWSRLRIVSWYYNVKQFLRNLPLFIKLAWNWRSWDSQYTITVFYSLLRKNAQAINQGYNHRNRYRRCLTAAAKLERAYNFSEINDKGYRYLRETNPCKFEKVGDYYTKLVYDYKISEEYYKKRWNVVHKRVDREEKELKQDAWNYVHKYIETFWD
jgi:hypothetical protein